MNPDMKRRISFRAAYDKRNPDPKKNYGVHGVEIRFVLSGPKGATQFVLFTHWQLPHAQEEHDARAIHEILAGDSFYLRQPFFLHKPMPADLGYHSPQPRYEGQERLDCEYLDQGYCYYDGSTSNAEPVFKRLLHEGDEGVWSALEEYYSALFGEESAE